MITLNLAPNLQRPDDLYEALVGMHQGLSDDQSLTLWAKFALILMNHIGDREVIEQAIAEAKAG